MFSDAENMSATLQAQADAAQASISVTNSGEKDVGTAESSSLLIRNLDALATEEKVGFRATFVYSSDCSSARV
jgi:hypothetical protein